MKKTKKLLQSRRLMAGLLCVSMITSMVSGYGIVANATPEAASAESVSITAGARRQADPSTMDKYKDVLDFTNDTRYAGRLWSDKSVFAYGGVSDIGDRAGLWDSTHSALTLTNDLDGVESSIALDADFLHVYSVLGSSIQVDDPVPADLVMALDISGSMNSPKKNEGSGWINTANPADASTFREGLGFYRGDADNLTSEYYTQAVSGYQGYKGDSNGIPDAIVAVLPADGNTMNSLPHNQGRDDSEIINKKQHGQMGAGLLDTYNNYLTFCNALVNALQTSVGSTGMTDAQVNSVKTALSGYTTIADSLTAGNLTEIYNKYQAYKNKAEGVATTSHDPWQSYNTDDGYVQNALWPDKDLDEAISKIYTLPSANPMQNANNAPNRMYYMIEAANDFIEQYLSLNDKNRISIIVYDSVATVVAPLAHYTSEDGKYLSAEKHHWQAMGSGGQWASTATFTAKPTSGYAKNEESTIFGSLLNGGTYTSSVTSWTNTGTTIALNAGLDILRASSDSYEDLADRLPVMILMTDGAANIAMTGLNANTSPASGSTITADWTKGSVKSTISEDNKGAVFNTVDYTVLSGSGTSYSVLNNTDAFKTGTSAGLTVYGANFGHIYGDEGNANIRYTITLNTLMSTAYQKSLVEQHYNQTRNTTDETDALIYTIGFGVESYGTNVQSICQEILNPKDNFKENHTVIKSPDSTEDYQGAYNTMYGQYTAWFDGSNISDKRTYARSGITFDFPIEAAGFANGGVSKAEIDKNIRYNAAYFTADMTSTENNSNTLGDVFDTILSVIQNELFTPVGGGNDLGMEDSITYIDSMGKYMEVKDVKKLLLFGELHDVVKTAVYDYSFNDEYAKGAEFKNGWYKIGVDGKVEKFEEASESHHWEDGWEYHVNTITAQSFLPNEKGGTISEASSKLRNATYTFYRLNDPKADRDELRMNPAYGTEVPDSAKAAGVDHTSIPGVYKLSDLRIWVEDTGDYTDDNLESGGTESDTNFDQALYVNLPVNMLPLRTVVVRPTWDNNNNQIIDTYTTNLDAASTGYKASFPMRVFYTVGVEESVLNADRTINVAGVSAEYLTGNKVNSEAAATGRGLASGDLEFFSNWYNPLARYNSYAISSNDYTYGDPVVSFSPNADNRYYVMEKSLPVYSRAFVYTDGEWKAVVITEGAAPNSGTTFNPAAFGKKLLADNLDVTTVNTAGINSALGTAIPVDGDIVLLENDLIKDTRDVNREGGNGDFTSTDYYYIALEYYELNDATKTVEKVKHVVTRKGSEFGSAYESINLTNGELLCWYDTTGTYTETYPYLSATETGVYDRGKSYIGYKNIYVSVGDHQELKNVYGGDLYDESGNEITSLENISDGTVVYAKTYDENGVEIKGSDGKPVMIRVMTVVSDQIALNTSFTDNEKSEAKTIQQNGNWVVAAKVGGLRVGDLAKDVKNKGGAYTSYSNEFIAERYGSEYIKQEGVENPNGLTWHYSDQNTTRTANNYYVPTISGASSNNASTPGATTIVNTYLGNNGRLWISVPTLLLTKTVVVEGEEKPSDIDSTEFQYQVYIEGFTGAKDATVVRYDAAAGTWQPQLHYIDLELDSKLFLQTKDGNNAMVDVTGKRVIANSNADGTTYVYAEGGGEYTGTVYYVYIGTNDNTDEFDSETAMRVYHNELVDDYKIAEEDVTVKDNEDGTHTFYAAEAYLVPVNSYGSFNPSSLSSLTKITNFELLTLKYSGSSDGSADMAISSPYRTASAYWTETLYFGYNAEKLENYLNEAGVTFDATDEEGLADCALTAEDLYDQNAIAANTAETTLKNGYGLQFSGMDAGKNYRFTEKLTDANIDRGYTLDHIDHIADSKKTTYGLNSSDMDTAYFDKAGHVYSVFGTIDALLEESGHYYNLWNADKTETQINGQNVTPSEEGGNIYPGVQVGDKITYEIKWANNTGEKAKVVITDPLDIGVSFVEADGGMFCSTAEEATQAAGFEVTTERTVVWNLGEQEIDAQGKVTLTVEVNEAAKEFWDYDRDGVGDAPANDFKVLNRATVRVADHEYNTNTVVNPLGQPSKTETAIDRATQASDSNGEKLEITKDDLEQKEDGKLHGPIVFVGDKITYEVEWHNYMNEEATVTVRDPLDPNVEFVSASFDPIDTKDSDGNPLGDAGPEKTEINSENPSNSILTYDKTKHEIVWNLDKQPGGAKGKVTLVVKVLESATPVGYVDNTAFVQINNEPELQTNTIENPTPQEEKTEVTPGDGVMIPIGDEITYQINWQNYHEDEARVVIMDTLDPGVDFVGASDGGVYHGTGGTIPAADSNKVILIPEHTVVWVLEKQPGYAEGSVTLTVKVNKNAKVDYKYNENADGLVETDGSKDYEVLNQARVKVENDPFVKTQVVENPIPEKTETDVEHADVSLNTGDLIELTPKEGEDNTYVGPVVFVGDIITYKIHWKNGHKEPATVVVTDKLDPGVDFEDAYLDTDSGAKGIYNPESHAVTWSLNEQAAGANGAVILKVKVNSKATEAGIVENQAQVKVGTDPAVKTEIIENPTPKEEKIETDPGEGMQVMPDDEIEYEIRWHNYRTTAADVVITDKLDPGVDFLFASVFDAISGKNVTELEAVIADEPEKETDPADSEETDEGKENGEENTEPSEDNPVNPETPETPETPAADTDSSTDEPEEETNPADFEEIEEGAGEIVQNTVSRMKLLLVSLDGQETEGNSDGSDSDTTEEPSQDPGVAEVPAVNPDIPEVSQGEGGSADTNNPDGNEDENKPSQDSEALEKPSTDAVNLESGQGEETDSDTNGSDVDGEVDSESPEEALSVHSAADAKIEYTDEDGNIIITIEYNAETHTVKWTLKDRPAGSDGVVKLKVRVNEKAEKFWSYDNPTADPDDNRKDDRVRNQAGVKIGNDPEVKTRIIENPTKPSKTETEINDRDVSRDLVAYGNDYIGPNVYVGDRITYRITWQNNASDEEGKPAPATITITDELDNGVDFVDASDNGTYDSGTHTVTWDLGEKEARVRGYVTLTVLVNRNAVDPGQVENDATVNVGNNPQQTDKIINKVKEAGKLTVSKIVSGNQADVNKDWNFRVELGDKTISGEYGEMFFVNGVAEFTLKHSESRTAENLPLTSYEVKEREANQDNYRTSVYGDIGTIPKGDTASAAFENNNDNLLLYGDLRVTKTVTGAEGDANKDWNFRVELSDTGINGTYGDIVFADGVAEFTLKHGESKTATGLPENVTYTVTEREANKDGYTTSSTGENGTIIGGQEVTASYVNDKPSTPPKDPEPEEPKPKDPEPENPKPRNPKPEKVPKTGDNSHMGLWIAVLAVSLVGALVSGMTLFKGRRGDRGRNKKG